MGAADPSLCPCGSGLRHVRCCALDLAAPWTPGAGPDLRPLVERAVQAHRTGTAQAAEALCLDILELAPTQREALRVLYELRKAGGHGRAAEALVRRLVAFDPNDAVAAIELALTLMNKGSLAEAEIHARNAVRLAPTDPRSHNALAMILTESHKPQAGEYHYRRVLDLSHTRDPILLANLAWNLKNQGRMDEARRLYEESGTAAPDIPQTLLGWARLEEADRRFDQAGDILDRAEKKFPRHAGFMLTRAVLLGRLGRYEQALATLNRIQALDGGNTLGPDELLEKGALLDRMGRYDDAFAAFEEGKRKLRELTGHRYLAEEADRLAQRLERFFVRGRLSILPSAGVREDTAQPVFILGFPRSGTTLVEQSLSAHASISAGDELPLVSEITEVIPRMFGSPLTYPEALAELWMAEHHEGLDSLRDHYLQRVRQLGVVRPGTSWFTDKMPLNETHLGLIALIFPEAPLIHVVRHPLDVVLSVFSNHLTHGFFCSYELETAARHYVLTMDLVEHYRREMALRYLPVRYEDVVSHQEAALRRMLRFIGLEFDANCLNFHENRRYARTASYAQVTEKLYDRSRFRYRHYRRHLEPVIPILKPVIERLGYTVS